MSSIEAQFEEIDRTNSWQKVLEDLKIKATTAPEFAVAESRKPESRERNRFNDILPYDRTRVLLQPCGKACSDYINASFVKVPEARRSYICAQSPLTKTVIHFWEMIWHHKCSAIVMLNTLRDKENRETCARYWPEKPGTSLVFPDDNECHSITVMLEEEDVAGSVFVVRKLRVSYDSKNAKGSSDTEERTIWHFNFTHWPDFGVPQCPDEFLDFLGMVRQSGCFDVEMGKEESNPVVVHCTAGVGRTGTLVLVDTCLALLALYRVVDVPSQLLELRKMRMGMVQTPHQLRFCYQAVILGKKRASMETPAVSPKHRPATLTLKPEPPVQMSPSYSSAELPPPTSPRRELLRQDGRTPSLDALEPLAQQTGKRRKVENGDIVNGIAERGAESAFVILDSVAHGPGVANGSIKQLSDQQKRDAEIRQRRLQHNEKLKEQIKLIKHHQEHPPLSPWKPWMIRLAVVGCGAAAVYLVFLRQ